MTATLDLTQPDNWRGLLSIFENNLITGVPDCRPELLGALTTDPQNVKEIEAMSQNHAKMTQNYDALSKTLERTSMADIASIIAAVLIAISLGLGILTFRRMKRQSST